MEEIETIIREDCFQTRNLSRAINNSKGKQTNSRQDGLNQDVFWLFPCLLRNQCVEVSGSFDVMKDLDSLSERKAFERETHEDLSTYKRTNRGNGRQGACHRHVMSLIIFSVAEEVLFA